MFSRIVQTLSLPLTRFVCNLWYVSMYVCICVYVHACFLVLCILCRHFHCSWPGSCVCVTFGMYPCMYVCMYLCFFSMDVFSYCAYCADTCTAPDQVGVYVSSLICIYVSMYLCICIWMFSLIVCRCIHCPWPGTCVCTIFHMYLCTCVSVHTYTHMYLHVHTYIHTYIRWMLEATSFHGSKAWERVPHKCTCTHIYTCIHTSGGCSRQPAAVGQRHGRECRKQAWYHGPSINTQRQNGL